MRAQALRIVAGILLMLSLAGPALALNVAVEEFTLTNGLRVVVIPDRRAPVVTHMVWYRVGSADEPEGKAGLAHFLEHLMFKGTPRFPGGAFSRLIRSNGGDENAFTTRDYTAYFQRIAKDRLGLVMELEADRMQSLVLSDEQVLPERQVVQEERRERIENDPSSLLGEQMDAALYTVHPYRKPVIGWMPEVAKLTRQDALGFYRAHYQPENAVVVVAGDVTVEDVRSLAGKYYGPLRNLNGAARRGRAEEPEPVAERRIILRDARASTPVWRRTYMAPASAKLGLRGDVTHQILADALGGGSQSRLHKEVVLKQKLAAYVGAWYSGDALDHGSFGIYAAPNPGISVEQLEAAIDTVLTATASGGINAEELEHTRNSLTAQSTYLLDSQDMLARVFGTALMTGQTVRNVLDWNKEVNAVTLPEVAAAASRVIDPRASVTGILLPEGAP
jgi:zinc protease